MNALPDRERRLGARSRCEPKLFFASKPTQTPDDEVRRVADEPGVGEIVGRARSSRRAGVRGCAAARPVPSVMTPSRSAFMTRGDLRREDLARVAASLPVEDRRPRDRCTASTRCGSTRTPWLANAPYALRHLEEADLERAERHRRVRLERGRQPELSRAARSRREARAVEHLDGGDVRGFLERLSQGEQAVVLLPVVLRLIHGSASPARRRRSARRARGRTASALLQRRGVDERLERRARLAPRLDRRDRTRCA